jgi:hypothetical protein
MLNTHCFVGYFEFYAVPSMWIYHTQNFMEHMTDHQDLASDTFVTSLCWVSQNPIMYSKPDYTTFNVTEWIF